MSTRGIKAVEGFIAALEAKDWRQVSRYLTGDFIFSGPPQPLRRDGYLALLKALGTALPDLAFHLHDVEPDPGGTVTAKIQITGTHTNPLTLPGAHIPAILPTGKQITLPEERVEFVPAGDKIAAIAIFPAPGGGIPGLLEQLGARVEV